MKFLDMLSKNGIKAKFLCCASKYIISNIYLSMIPTHFQIFFQYLFFNNTTTSSLVKKKVGRTRRAPRQGAQKTHSPQTEHLLLEFCGLCNYLLKFASFSDYVELKSLRLRKLLTFDYLWFPLVSLPLVTFPFLTIGYLSLPFLDLTRPARPYKAVLRLSGFLRDTFFL